MKCFGTRKYKLIMLAICVGLILFTAIFTSLLQSSFGRVEIVQIQNEDNSGFKMITATDTGEEKAYAVNGHVASGLLYIPKNAHQAPAPGIVMTHGAFNNKEMQESFAIEMARRGFVVLCVDGQMHGDNEDAADTYTGNFLLQGAKYLYNLTNANGKKLVDPERIGVSGHSMGGGYTNSALQLDGMDTIGADFEGATDAALTAGFHMGIFSAGAPEAADPDNNCYGSNLKGVAVIKGNADEWYYNSTMKEPEYIMISKDFMSQDVFNQGLAGTYQAIYAYNPTSFSMQWSGSIDGKLYVKQGDSYKAVDNTMSFNKNTQYYKYDTHGNSIFFLRSAESLAFVNSQFNPETFTGTAYKTVDHGIYNFADGTLVSPNQAEDTLLSISTKGQQQASNALQIRAVYEERETHPMNHFSYPSTANYADFFYNVFGVPTGARFISPNNQTWTWKQGISVFGFLGMFGLLISLCDILLDTKAFAMLKAPAESKELPSFKKNWRKLVSYIFIAASTIAFSAYSYSQMNNNGKWFANSFLYDVIQNNVLKVTSETYYIFHNVGLIAHWGIVCGAFAVIITAVVWFINRVINMVIYKDDYTQYDEAPFAGFRIRGWGHTVRTLGLVAIVCTVFWGIVQLMWKTSSVGFYFWTFGLRHFDAAKLPSMLRYLPFFAVYYVINAAMGVNYKVKELPEWVSIIINVLVNVIGVTVLVWVHNNHNLTYGNMTQYGNSLMYLLSYPVIPCVAFATVVGRRLHVRTGNGWLGGLINAVIMTIMACANTGWTGII